MSNQFEISQSTDYTLSTLRFDSSWVNECLQGDDSKSVDVHSLVLWLENRIIRSLDVSERTALTTESSWDLIFSKYLSSLNCPFQWGEDSVDDCIHWLIDYATNLDYEEREESLGNCDYLNGGVDDDNLMTDGQATSVQASLMKFGDLIGIQRLAIESNLVYAKRLTIHSKFNGLSLNKQTVQAREKKEFDLTNYSPGFDIDDYTLRAIFVVLKMLHLSDFRDLQSDMNSLIIAGQEYTANPKTNSALGKVGT